MKRLDKVLMKSDILLLSSSRLTNLTHAMVPTMQKRLNCVTSIFRIHRIVTSAQALACQSLIMEHNSETRLRSIEADL